MMTKSQQAHQTSQQHHLKANAISTHNMSDQDQASSSDDQSPPISPLRSPQLSSSNSSIWSWSSSSQSSQSSNSDPLEFDPQQQCNSKEERSSYNTKFARYHLETYKQNDRLRWNFDFDHNRPVDDNTHHHHRHATVAARYQWDPAI